MNNKSISFIGGAPKSGTSSLFHWLSKHPYISPSTPKETFFYIDETNPLINKSKNAYISTNDEFLEYFDYNKEMFLEGTTHLLYQSKEIIEKLYSSYPHAKYIFVLREPVKRLESSFNYTKNNLLRIKRNFSLNDYISSFHNNTLSLINENIENDKSSFVLQRDLEYGYYSNFLKNWYEIVPKNKIKIVLFENLKKEPYTTVQEVCEFLDISSAFFKGFNFEKENESLIIKYVFLYKIGKKIGGIFNKQRQIKKVLKKMISRKKSLSDEKISDSNLAFLKDKYKFEISHLKDLGVELDFTSWVK